MSASAAPDQLESRLCELERRLSSVEAVVTPRRRSAPPPVRVVMPPVDALRSQPPSVAPPSTDTPSVAPPSVAPPSVAPPSTDPPPRLRQPVSLGDLVGGRVLAWIGGVATLFGIVLFLALAVARGWIGPEARVALAGLGSAALLGTGVWLHAKRGRTEASIVLVGVATCGLFVTLLVASHVYALIAPQVAVIGAIATGAVATILAIRWAGIAIAMLGLLGALLSPLFVGAPMDAFTLVMLAVSATCATWTAVRQRWDWLAYAGLAICIPQWGQYVLGSAPLGLRLSVIGVFGAIGLAGALATQAAAAKDHLVPAAVVMFTTNATVVALIGAFALRDDRYGLAPVGNDVLALWFLAVGAVHAVVGLTPIKTICVAMRRLALVVGVILADLAFGLTASPLTLAIGWAALAVGFAVLSRRPFDRESDRTLIELGMGHTSRSRSFARSCSHPRARSAAGPLNSRRCSRSPPSPPRASPRRASCARACPS